MSVCGGRLDMLSHINGLCRLYNACDRHCLL